MSPARPRAWHLALALLGACTGWRLPLPPPPSDAPLTDAPLTDARAMDDAFDAPLTDAPVTDTPSVDAPVTDAPADDAPTDLDPPRPLSPLSTATVTSQRPTLHWAAATAGSAGTRVRVCRDRACAMMAREFTAAGAATSGVVPDPALTPGVWFWNVRAMCGAAPCPRASATWQFTVGHASAPRDASYGTSPDFNGDGVADLVVGAPGQIVGPRGEILGAVWVHPGPLRAAVNTQLSAPDRTMGDFGTAVAAAGDVNGDGYGDLVATSPNSMGAAYFYLGSATGVPTAPTVVRMGSGGEFGSVLAGAGDIDRDGYGDVVVGAPAESGGGAVYVIRGSMVGPSSMLARIASPVAADTGFGTRVAGAGDVDGDGYADVVVSSTAGTGRVYLYRGGRDGLRTPPMLTLSSPMGLANFGRGLAGGGDVNGDGLSDVAVAAPDGAGGGTIRAWVYLGSASVVLMDGSPLPVNDSTAQLSSGFGAALALNGDVDGDGLADLVVGAPRAGNSATSTGQAFVLRINAARTGFMSTRLANGMPRLVNFGASVGCADYNGDGFLDAAAGDPFTSSSGAGVYVYTGSASGPAATPIAVLSGTGSDFGRAIALQPPRVHGARGRERAWCERIERPRM